ncbi:VanW family protein, partial [Staphylococcus aureus]|uniref:VanW family protein n=1 Tax=Staphylococcus aureus TaxID=1280 RepID=UPI0022823092
SNNWTHTWAGLDEKAKGQQVKYTVEQLTKVKGYTTHVDNNDMGNLIVTNKYTPETTSISGEKVWDDKDNQDGKRPEKVSRTFKKEQLPNVVHSYSTHLIKKGKDIDPELQYNKAYNIQLASSKMDGIIIKPGEEFSFWKLVGKINKKNGYKDGRVIIN